ncbi:AAA-domain-containing protein [Clavulina sp. PMI_390]|nr:AAA-domain-containing protein [Clavulina sp. PMI_390]
MSGYFRSGGQPNPPGQYSRVPSESQGGGLPSGPRGGRVPPPPANDYGAYEKRSAPSSRGGHFGVVSCPTPELAFANCVFANRGDVFAEGQHCLIRRGFPVTIRHDPTGAVAPGTLGFTSYQRQWIGLSAAGDSVDVEPIDRSLMGNDVYLESIDIEVGFQKARVQATETYKSDEMVKAFMGVFNGIVLANGQILVFDFHGMTLRGVIKGLSRIQLAQQQGGSSGPGNFGLVMQKTDITFVKAADSSIKIQGSAKKAPANAILAPNFKFEDMGIGGLDAEFASIFRRAFASRVFPPGLVEKLGIQHVKGLLLYGPPGTGKTLLARQIGKMLNAREPKIVNGPEILDKFVGKSEENIRKLFADAEAEYKAKGDESGLHIIIFDELDAITKQRGSGAAGGTGVGDTVVNQLLSKMDGVDQLNNILVIGMTNRKDMIDEALLRPGRLEVHVEISLPDEGGRLQILNIHTAKMRTNKIMDRDVSLEELAGATKNFSGAEIGGLVKSATSFAFNRHVKVGTMAGISDDVENLMVNRNDFMSALEEVKPAFGVSEEELAAVIQNGIIHYDMGIESILRDGKLFVEQVRTSSRTPLVSVLLHGPPGSGKTALAATIAQASDFPFIKLISPDSMVGFSESQKVTTINKVFNDSYKSRMSVIVIDNLERLVEWVPIGPRFSNTVLQALTVLIGRRPPEGHRLLILSTTSLLPMLSDMEATQVFDSEIRVPPISSLSAIERVLAEVDLFQSSNDLRRAISMLQQAGFAGDNRVNVGVKKLLSVIEMARQAEDPAEKLTSALLALS